jgi:predicted RNA-binding protein with RPS1 domain
MSLSLRSTRTSRRSRLGMKQIEVNPWELVGEKYPPGTVIEGKVRNLANYGAFVEIEPGIDGLLHISDMSWTKKVTHPNEVLKKGDTVRCVVLEVDQEKQRISLGIKQLTEDPWLAAIPEHYKPGMVVRGAVTKITNFGVFVELEDRSRGPAPHLRAGRPQGREPAGRGQGRRRGRRQDPPRRHRRSQDRPLAQARPVGRLHGRRGTGEERDETCPPSPDPRRHGLPRRHGHRQDPSTNRGSHHLNHDGLGESRGRFRVVGSLNNLNQNCLDV